MGTIEELDLDTISELELEIKAIDLVLEVSKQIMKDCPDAYRTILEVSRKRVWLLQAEIDRIISEPKAPTGDDDDE